MSDETNQATEPKKKTTAESANSDAKKNSPEVEKEKDFFDTTGENIEAGAEKVKEKISDFADKTSESVGEAYLKVKEKFSTVIDDISKTTQDYIEKYKNNVEVKRLSDKREKLTIDLGNIVFMKYRLKETLPQKFLEQKEILDLTNEIENLDKEIIEIAKNLEKNK